MSTTRRRAINADPKQPFELTHGNTARDRNRGRRARRVFHSTLAAGAALALGFSAAWWLGLGIVALVLVGLYLARVRPLYRSWHERDPDRCRDEWTERGDDVAREGHGPQAYRLAPADRVASVDGESS